MQKLITAILLSVLIVLPTTNCLASPQTLETDTTPELTLDNYLDFTIQIPQEDMMTVNGQPVYYYNADQFRLTLKIFETYAIAGNVFPLLQEKISLLEEETGLVYQAFNECNTTLNEVDQNRQELYQSIVDMKNIHKKQIAKEKLKTILIGAGVGVVGIAGGIIIGFFAIR